MGCIRQKTGPILQRRPTHSRPDTRYPSHGRQYTNHMVQPVPPSEAEGMEPLEIGWGAYLVVRLKCPVDAEGDGDGPLAVQAFGEVDPPVLIVVGQTDADIRFELFELKTIERVANPTRVTKEG